MERIAPHPRQPVAIVEPTIDLIELSARRDAARHKHDGELRIRVVRSRPRAHLGSCDTTRQRLDVLIRLVAIQGELCEAWERAFADVDAVDVEFGSILGYPSDALVSPANSFGFMDGGLDLVYSKHFGWQLEDRVRERILSEHMGELPVGQAEVVATGADDFEWLICAPTMRVPMDVSTTANAYLAFRAILLAARRHGSGIRSVACPGLGTGEGRMPAARCAAQMRYAYDVVVSGRRLTKGGLAAAVRNHLELVGQESQLR